MSTRPERRRFLKTAGAGALLGLGDLGFLGRLRPVSADEAKLDPAVVRFRPEIEPLVALLEETPRGRLLEEVAARINRGTSYQEVLAALLLAGVRNIQPRPSVGFKFHAVLVVNSAHLASLASPDSDRWLPIFWALDHFKDSQARDDREGHWTMGPVDESAVPPARKAREAFVDAMERWDEGAADAAVVALARTSGEAEVFELFHRLGARDFRSIGHKAIYVSNARRTLQCIGWQARRAGPPLARLCPPQRRGGTATLRRRTYPPTAPGARTRSASIGSPKAGGAARSSPRRPPTCSRPSDRPTRPGPRTRWSSCSTEGVAPQSLWDAMFDGAGELVMRQPGIVALHAATTTNALRYAFQAVGDDRTRRLLLLQNAAFLTLFREALGGRGRVADRRISDYVGDAGTGTGPETIEAIFAKIGEDRAEASHHAYAYLQSGGDPAALIDAARRLVFLKGNDAHDYKYSSARPGGLRPRLARLARSLFGLEPSSSCPARPRRTTSSSNAPARPSAERTDASGRAWPSTGWMNPPSIEPGRGGRRRFLGTIEVVRWPVPSSGLRIPMSAVRPRGLAMQWRGFPPAKRRAGT